MDFIAHAGSGHVQPRSSHGLYFVVFETLTDVQGGAQHIQSTCFAGSAAFAILESLVDSEPRCEALETRTNGGGLAVRNIQIGRVRSRFSGTVAFASCVYSRNTDGL